MPTKYTPEFEAAFAATLGYEGGYVNDPDDPGQETNFGISKRSYPNEDIRGLTLERAKELYHRDFFLRLHLDQVRGDIAAEVFDTAVNMGPSVAISIAQRSCNYLGSRLAVDGVVGPQTIHELRRHAAPDLLKLLNALQLGEYIRLVDENPAMQKYARGWLRRVVV